MTSPIMEAIEYFIRTDKKEELKRRIEPFLSDRKFVQTLDGIVKIEFKDMQPAQLANFAKILNHIVMPEYPTDVTTKMSFFYQSAISENAFPAFDKLISTLAELKNMGMNVSEQFAKENTYETNTNAALPFNILPGSYVNAVMEYWNQSQNNSSDRQLRTYACNFMDATLKHVKRLHEEGFDVDKMVKQSYVDVMKQIYAASTQNKLNFEEYTGKFIGTLKSLKENGYDVYNRFTHSALQNWITSNSLTELREMVQTFDRNYIVATLRIPLAQEDAAKAGTSGSRKME
jgi:hypothetical protein